MNPEFTYYEDGQKRKEEWFFNGTLHRLNGPAIQLWYPNGQKVFEHWWIYGCKFTKEQYDEAMELYNKSEVLFKLKYGGSL